MFLQRLLFLCHLSAFSYCASTVIQIKDFYVISLLKQNAALKSNHFESFSLLNRLEMHVKLSFILKHKTLLHLVILDK